MSKYIAFVAAAMVLVSGTAVAGQEVSNDLSRCAAGKGPAVLVSVRGVKESSGKVRVQSYPATGSAWLAKGRCFTASKAVRMRA
jgi:hypothetical protein